MAETPKNTLKQWFVTGAKPLQAQYWAWLDSYWHKSEAISINAINGLGEILESKADADQLQHYALLDASNIGVNQGAWRTALGINDITPPDVDLTNYYTRSEVDGLLENVTVDLTGYATESWVTTQTTPATQAEVEASTGTESNPTFSEPATENRKFLTLFNFFKLIKKLRYIHLLPNSNPSVANRLWSDGTDVYYDDKLAVPNKLAKDKQIYKIISGDVTLDNSYHNCIVRITANCIITVPNTLRADFNCVFDVIGLFTAQFVAGGTSTFSAPFGLYLRDNMMCTLYKETSVRFRVNGGLVAT